MDGRGRGGGDALAAIGGQAVVALPPCAFFDRMAQRPPPRPPRSRRQPPRRDALRPRTAVRRATPRARASDALGSPRLRNCRGRGAGRGVASRRRAPCKPSTAKGACFVTWSGFRPCLVPTPDEGLARLERAVEDWLDSGIPWALAKAPTLAWTKDSDHGTLPRCRDPETPCFTSW